MINRLGENSPTTSYPKVSVVSVSYQSIEVAEATLKSILNLNYPNLELIVVDNCSSDGTKEILQKYSSQIHHLIIQEDKGPYDAMNKAIQLSAGEWLWFMNMGDLVPPSKDLLLKVFQNGIDSKTLVLYGNTLVKKGTFTYQKIFAPAIEGNFRHGVLSLNHQSTLMRKQAFEEIGMYDFVSCPIKADALWFSKLFYTKGSVAFSYVSIELAIYNEEGLSSQTRNFAKMILEDTYILKLYGSSLNHLQLKWHSLVLKLRVLGLGLLEKNEGLYQAYRSIKYKNSKHIKTLPKE